MVVVSYRSVSFPIAAETRFNHTHQVIILSIYLFIYLEHKQKAANTFILSKQGETSTAF